MGTLFMYGPALGAIAATRWGLHQPLRWLGPVFGWNRAVVLAWIAPMAFAIAHVLVAIAFPGVSLQLDPDAIRGTLLATVPAAQRAPAEAQLASIGDWLPLLMAAQVLLGGLAAGLSVNALAAFGEELGWRGFLHRLWAPLGFWKRALLVGAIWGLWHAPLILRGHNYPQHPEVGVAAMVMFCVLLAPLLDQARERAGVLLAPVAMHGAINAGGGILLFVAGASDLLRGPTGLAGWIVLGVANLALWRWRARRGQPDAVSASSGSSAPQT
jgi:membrane protease YdiL (CAAX protease family)